MREEARRLALVRLQGMMAAMARREAMRALADALDEERRRSAVARRSAALLASANPREGAASAATLAERVRFAAGVARLAGDAEAAKSDAQRQAAWQADLLAAAETRARRIAELEASALRALEAARAARADAAVKLARKLQSAPWNGPAGPYADRNRG